MVLVLRNKIKLWNRAEKKRGKTTNRTDFLPCYANHSNFVALLISFNLDFRQQIQNQPISNPNKIFLAINKKFDFWFNWFCKIIIMVEETFQFESSFWSRKKYTIGDRKCFRDILILVMCEMLQNAWFSEALFRENKYLQGNV